MNKRIQELAKQADDGYTGINGDDMGHALVGEEAIEKFAELIVRECCECLNNEAERLYGLKHDDGDLLAEKCYDNIQGIKEHFGVEE